MANKLSHWICAAVLVGAALPANSLAQIKVDPNLAWGVPELTRELKIEDMDIPIRNKR